MSKFRAVFFLSAFYALFSSPARAQDDRALLATFCDAGNIKGKTCTRAKGYPNAPSAPATSR
jgi:hypothetical protein